MSKKEGIPEETKKDLRARIKELQDAGKDVKLLDDDSELVVKYGEQEFHFSKVYYTEAKIAALLEKNGIENLLKIDKSNLENL